ncbi:MAG: PQQ-binding-like beta-propeller repeat protein [Verrucomicrobiales bacterium]
MSARSHSLVLVAFLLGALAAPANPPADDARWADALKAYAKGQREQGHRLLAALAAEHPGDLDLAAACYEKILASENLPTSKAPVPIDRPWVTFATERLLALEQLGAHSANTSILRSAAAADSQFAVAKNRYLDAYETISRLRAANDHDLFWRMMEVRILRSMGLPEANTRIAELRQDYDPDHSAPDKRAEWEWIATEINPAGSPPLVARPAWARPPERWPVPAPVPPAGSPLSLLAPEDPEGRWRVITEPSPKGGVGAVDRLLGYTYAAAEGVPWRDGRGLLDSNRALDLHLLSKPAAELEALRQEQEALFAREAQTAARTEVGILKASRRYPWSPSAQALLLKLAGEALWDGRSESAWRSFHELLLHTTDPALREAAQTGLWTAQALLSGAAEVLAQPAAFESGKTYQWMGRPTKGEEIRAALQATLRPAPSVVPPSLTAVRLHVLQLPPIAPWTMSDSLAGFGVDLQVAGNRVVASARNVIAAYDATNPGAPLWTHLPHRSAAPTQNHWPGYYGGLIENGTLVSRWGEADLPGGLAAFDLASGDPQWTALGENFWNERRGVRPLRSSAGKQPLRFSVPMGDPVRADGRLFYLQWDSLHDLHAKQGTNLKLVCFDPANGHPRWTTTLSDPRFAGDFRGPTAAIYGNSVTVHRGAVYSCTNTGQIFRSDVRDGRIEWSHNYRHHPTSAEFLGSAPIIAGDNVICLPRDSGIVIALDQRTGFLVWENPLILAAEALGIWQDTLVLRGVATLAGLDPATGKTRWSRNLTGRTLDRSQLIADSIYLGHADSLVRLDARTGEWLETRPWALPSERALTFTLAGQDLYIVSDRPTDDPRQKTGQPLGPELASSALPLKLPLQRAWSLSRPDATLALPPAGVRSGTAYVISDGLIECLDVVQRGAIRWRRFLNASNPTSFFAGDTLILREREVSHLQSARVLALDSMTGVTLWESPVPVNHQHVFHFGTRILFHDGREKLVALDLATGQRAWQATLVAAHTQNPHWDGTHLHLFRAPAAGNLEHFTLDPATGDTIAQREVEAKPPGETPTAISELDDGTFEIRFAPAAARYFRVTTLSSSGGVGDYASAAEFYLLGPDGQRLPRDQWAATADHEPNAGLRAKPRNAIDGNPDSWWHSQWRNGQTPHPHHFIIDLGTAQTVSGFHYLPAKIINNNGLIAEFELHVSQDKTAWGAPVSRGSFSDNIRVNTLESTTSVPSFFEVRRQHRQVPALYRYDLTGNGVLVQENASLLRVTGPYALLSIRENPNGPETLAVRCADDPSYFFPLQINHDRHGQIHFVGDYAITYQGKLEIADLKSKRQVALPADENAPIHQGGFLCRIGPDRLLKIVNHEGKQLAFIIDLQSGNMTAGVLENQSEPINENLYARPGGQSLSLTFDQTFLTSDNSSISAWVAAPR